MATLPLLFFPQTTVEGPAPRGGRGTPIVKPSAAQQKARHDQKFQDIADSFEDLASSIEGMDPEQVIVLETIGEAVDDLAKAAAQVPGLEWLTEIELDDCEPSDGFQYEDEKKADKPLTRRLYGVGASTSRTPDRSHGDKCQYVPNSLAQSWNPRPGSR